MDYDFPEYEYDLFSPKLDSADLQIAYSNFENPFIPNPFVSALGHYSSIPQMIRLNYAFQGNLQLDYSVTFQSLPRYSLIEKTTSVVYNISRPLWLFYQQVEDYHANHFYHQDSIQRVALIHRISGCLPAPIRQFEHNNYRTSLHKVSGMYIIFASYNNLDKSFVSVHTVDSAKGFRFFDIVATFDYQLPDFQQSLQSLIGKWRIEKGMQIQRSIEYRIGEYICVSNYDRTRLFIDSLCTITILPTGDTLPIDRPISIFEIGVSDSLFAKLVDYNPQWRNTPISWNRLDSSSVLAYIKLFFDAEGYLNLMYLQRNGACSGMVTERYLPHLEGDLLYLTPPGCPSVSYVLRRVEP